MPGALLYPDQLDLPFLKVPGLGLSCRDPQAWATALQGVMPVRRCEPLRLHRPFRNRTAVADLGVVQAIATHGSAISVSTEEREEAMLLLPYRGTGVWTSDGHSYENPVGESVLFLPPAAVQLENSVTSGVALNVAPEQLVRTALIMAGPDGIGRDLVQACHEPRLVPWRQPAENELINSLYRTLQAADQALRTAAAAVPLLCFDDLLIRLTLLLLIPELRGIASQPAGAAPPQRGAVQLAALTEWMDAHLHLPLSLSDLERQAHCSRRTLQVHFRRRHGCSPMQWLRRRRLEKALQRLRKPLPGTSVWAVAQSCGYTSLAAFSRDFRARHGLRPSDLLRQAAGPHRP